MCSRSAVREKEGGAQAIACDCHGYHPAAFVVTRPLANYVTGRHVMVALTRCLPGLSCHILENTFNVLTLVHTHPPWAVGDGLGDYPPRCYVGAQAADAHLSGE